jgi:hypothetical protein
VFGFAFNRILSGEKRESHPNAPIKIGWNRPLDSPHHRIARKSRFSPSRAPTAILPILPTLPSLPTPSPLFSRRSPPVPARPVAPLAPLPSPCSRRSPLRARVRRRAGGAEDARGLAGEPLLAPEVAGAVQERLELRRQHAEPGGEPEEDAVGLHELRGGDGRHARPLRGRAHLRQRLAGERLRDLPQRRLDAGDGRGAPLDLLRQRRDMAVRGVVPATC